MTYERRWNRTRRCTLILPRFPRPELVSRRAAKDRPAQCTARDANLLPGPDGTIYFGSTRIGLEDTADAKYDRGNSSDARGIII